jgi:NAD(P)-dependent dehydrogenase (short-subunit alcohol dehydrogenase family)
MQYLVSSLLFRVDCPMSTCVVRCALLGLSMTHSPFFTLLRETSNHNHKPHRYNTHLCSCKLTMKSPIITKYPLQRVLLVLTAFLSFVIQYPQPVPLNFNNMASSYVSSTSVLEPLQGITVVITGATSGLGLSLSKKVHGMGGTIVAVGRSESKLKLLSNDLQNERVHTILADFKDLDSISDAANQIRSKFKTIDYLICNAGITSEEKATPQNFDPVFAVNYLSHVLLTERLIPNLKRSKLEKGARIINVSSTMHIQVDGDDLVPTLNDSPVASQPLTGYVHSWKSYGNSKLAQIYYARSLSRKLNQDSRNKIKVLSLCPSWVATNIAGSILKYFLDIFAFQSDGFGISPILFAMFDTTGGDTDDFIGSNSLTAGGKFFKFMKSLLRLGKWPLVRLTCTSMGAGIVLVLQKFFANVGYSLTSVEGFNMVYQDALYDWSLDVLKPWVKY